MSVHTPTSDPTFENRPRDAAHSTARPTNAAAGEPIIRAGGLGKKFRIYAKPLQRLSEWLTGGRAVRHEAFWALRNISFDVKRGEAVGIIGINGSGKSTLLKILSGAMYRLKAPFSVEGRALSLLELGTGLNPQLTGRQNVMQSATLLALTPEFVLSKLAEIEAFAELGDFFDRPIRLYSSGMLVRLVFSMFAHFEPDVFIVDEALSVGDLHFQQKCAVRIRAMLDRGVTMLFVSHDLNAVASLCDRVMVLHQGTVRFIGDKQQGISLYYSLIGANLTPGVVGEGDGAKPLAASQTNGADSPFESQHDTATLPWQSPDPTGKTDNGTVKITGICYQRDTGEPSQVIPRGEWVHLFVRYEALESTGPLNCGVTLHDRLNQLLFAVNWLNAEIEPIAPKTGDTWITCFKIRADLEPEEYALSLDVSVSLPDPQSPTGWNQHLGGGQLLNLPRGGKIAVVPAADKRRKSFGPANLEYAVSRLF